MSLPALFPVRSSALRVGALLLVPMLLAGCSLLGGSKDPTSIYITDPEIRTDASWPTVPWQLTISRPEASRMVDSLRIAVRPSHNEVQVYKDAAWAKLPSEQIVDVLMRTLDESGRITAVARQGSGVAADYKLVLDIRRFHAEYAGAATPSAVVDVNAKLLQATRNHVLGARTFQYRQAAAGTDVPSVVRAFEQALGQLGSDMGGWILTTGQSAPEVIGDAPR